VLTFDMQQILVAAAAALAFWRIRYGLFVMCANQVVALQAFRNIRAFGQPITLAYLPPEVFTPPNIAAAEEVFAVFSVMLAVGVLLPEGARTPRPELPRLPRVLLWAIAVYFSFYFVVRGTIVEGPHGADRIQGLNLTGGLYPFAWALVLLELRRRIEAKEISQRRALAVVGVGLFLLDYLKGVTGLPTGIVGLAVFTLGLPGAEPTAEARPSQDMLKFAVAFLAVAVLSAGLVRGVRSTLGSEGLAASLDRYAEQLSLYNDAEVSGEGLEGRANASQTAAHVLMCTLLYDSGYDRDWRSVWGAFEYTFKPSMLTGPLGLERSREAAWELGDYYVHNGGINVIGELYWNGGLTCVVIVGGILILLIYACDTRGKRSVWWFGLSLAVGPGLLQGYGYGFAQIFRGFANGIVYVFPLLALAYYLQWQREKAAQQSMRVGLVARRREG
jgi:hypothetical protein